MKLVSKSVLLFSALVFTFPTAIHAQRDYFTNEEVDVVREAQQIDQRIAVLVHIIDRRFYVLKADVGANKIASEKKDVWGELPSGTNSQLLLDIKRILQKAVDDIDNLAERPDSAVAPDKAEKNAPGYAQLFPKAVRGLAAAAERYRPALKAQLDTATADADRGSIMDSLDLCDEIIAAVAKLPAEASKKAAKGH